MNNHRQNCIASLMTAKTVAAISSIQLVGESAKEILTQIFNGQTHRSAPTIFTIGSILHGHIFDDDRDIDEVIIGCEVEDSFSINCHGNPIIVENILELLKKHGAKITEAQEIIAYQARKKYGDNTIAIEAEIAVMQAATLDGAKIIQHQMKMGLLQTAEWWLKNIDAMEFEDIRLGAEQILADSKNASYFINGAKIVIAGPPNSGKSTLFNYLCGKEKAIVTDIAGTTRDWLSAKIRLKRIMAEFFDTAGLDRVLSDKNIIDAESQGQAAKLIKAADLVLYVTETADYADFTEKIEKCIICFNKCDLKNKIVSEGVKISAKTGDGIKELLEKIEKSLGVVDFDMKKTVCFTDRQEKIMREAASAQNKAQIKNLIQELLKGSIFV